MYFVIFVVIQGGLSFFNVMYLFGIVFFAASNIVFYFDTISEKINTKTNGSKNWWNLVKSLLHSDSGGDRSILPLQVENFNLVLHDMCLV
jgi:hypothetical protein